MNPAAPASTQEWTARAAEVVEVARRLNAHGLVIGTTGSVSCRVRGGMLITPTRRDYATMHPHDLVFVAEDGRYGDRSGANPSTEAPLHTAIYAGRPDAGAVVHCHSPHATAWSYLDEPLAPATEDTAYYGIGAVATATFAPAGSTQLGSLAAEAIGDARAVLLAGHGVVTVGSDPTQALIVAQVIEHQAQVAWLLRGTGAHGHRSPGFPGQPAPSHHFEKRTDR
jgi:L-fuculose-phosphate aldolase